MKKYFIPNAEIIYLLTTDVIQTSGDQVDLSESFDTYSGDGAMSMLPNWDGLL